MGQLDGDDVPMTSSAGARRRAVQLMTQLPAQDVAGAFCRQLGEDRQQLDAFDEFRRTRDADVMDVALVTSAIKHTAVRHGMVSRCHVGLHGRGHALNTSVQQQQQQQQRMMTTHNSFALHLPAQSIGRETL